MARKRRIMRSFVVNEIAGVDVPAQKGARALLMKRDSGDVKKYGDYLRPKLLSEVKGHSHLIDLADGPGGTTSWSTALDEDSSHGHPWVLGLNGNVVIGAADGHVHDVLEKKWEPEDDGLEKRVFSAERREELARQGKALPDGSYPIVTKTDLRNAIKAFGRAKNKGRVAAHIKRRAKALKATDLLPEEGLLAKQSAGDGGGNLEEEKNSMDQKKEIEAAVAKAEAAAKEKLDKAQAELAEAQLLAKLNDSEKAHLAGLADEGKATFLKLDADGRKAELAKAGEADPVVYTSGDGSEFRKSDDARLIAQAKRADEALELAKAERTKREDQDLAKRAETELGNLPDADGGKVALLKAVDGIADEKARAGAAALLAAGNKGLEKAFDRAGTRSSQSGDAAERYEAMSKKYAEENKVTIEQARADVLSTPEGVAVAEELRGQSA